MANSRLNGRTPRDTEEPVVALRDDIRKCRKCGCRLSIHNKMDVCNPCNLQEVLGPEAKYCSGDPGVHTCGGGRFGFHARGLGD